MRRFLGAAVLLALVSCASETVVSRVSEKEANQILVLLTTKKVGATKLEVEDGRETYYNILVPAGDKLTAYRVLNEHDYPRRPISSRGEIFSGDGLIPTSAEEKAKEMMALEGEIERQLMVFDGMLDVQVNVNVPEESALRAGEPPPPATASVVYRAKNQTIKASEVAAVVAAATENLSPERVQVIPTIVAGPENTAAARRSGGGIFDRFPANVQQAIAAGASLIFLLMALIIFYQSLSLRNVRTRFRRLQEEIARARRPKTPDSLPS